MLRLCKYLKRFDSVLTTTFADFALYFKFVTGKSPLLINGKPFFCLRSNNSLSSLVHLILKMKYLKILHFLSDGLHCNTDGNTAAFYCGRNCGFKSWCESLREVEERTLL